MPVMIGLLLIPVVCFIMYKANLVVTSKKSRILLNVLLILITVIFIAFCWIVRAEPFNFEDQYSLDYMIYSGSYILYTGIMVLFTPFIWMVVIHFVKMLLYSLRVRKNAVIKRSGDFIYYRGDLDKVSPAILMFVSKLEIDLRKSIAATILKLKHSGYIEEKEGTFFCTDKDEKVLCESEGLVLTLIRNHTFSKDLYKKAIEKETLKSRYLTKNYGGILFRIVKMLIAVCIPVAIEIFSTYLDTYVHENYWVYPEDNGYAYIVLNNEEEIQNLYMNEIEDINDYYHRTMSDGSQSYHYDEIRADKFQYSVVRKAFFLNVLTSLMVGFISVFVLLGLYIFIEQICYFTKSYTRTRKGKMLLNKAYALKNYLKDYSLIKERREEELALWEYYLIYAVALDVNVKLEDAIIERYLEGIDGI